MQEALELSFDRLPIMMSYVSTRQLDGKLRKFKRKFPHCVPPFTATMCTRVATFRATRPVSAQNKTGRIRKLKKLQDIGVR